ncbi:MAG: DUF883 domain-containing protein [Burkholderiales bacterium]|nr:DUF883 domain-containing protein [Burkholderiales bacterium]
MSSSTPMTGADARESAAHMSDKAHAGIDRISASAHNTVDRMASAATSAASRLADGKLASTAQEWKETGCAYVREHPVAAVGIAAAVGFLLSRLTSFR